MGFSRQLVQMGLMRSHFCFFSLHWRQLVILRKRVILVADLERGLGLARSFLGLGVPVMLMEASASCLTGEPASVIMEVSASSGWCMDLCASVPLAWACGLEESAMAPDGSMSD